MKFLKIKKYSRYFEITSKFPVRCTDNFVIFYLRWFWRMLYIYYKEKVNKIKVKKHIHFETLKISLVVSLHICSLLKVRFFFFFKNHETKNKCESVTKPWKSTNFCDVHIFHSMK